MKITRFNARITKTKKTKIDDYENYENLKIGSQNKNHKNNIIPLENYKKQRNLKFKQRIIQIMKIFEFPMGMTKKMKIINFHKIIMNIMILNKIMKITKKYYNYKLE